MTKDEIMKTANTNRTYWLVEIKKLADKGELTARLLAESLQVHHISRNANTILVIRGVMQKQDKLWKWISPMSAETVASKMAAWSGAYDKKLKEQRALTAAKEKAEAKRLRDLKKQDKLKNAGGGAKPAAEIPHAISQPDNIDEIIKLAAVAAEYGIEDKKGFIKKMLEK